MPGKHILKQINRIYPGINFITKLNVGPEWSEPERCVPSTVYIETTNVCNARCIMCPTGRGLMSRPKGFMSWEMFREITDQLMQFERNGLYIHLHLHGESLFDPLLFERVSLVKNKLVKSRVSLNTNGALLDEDKAKRLIASTIDEIFFSLNGTSDESYKQISPGLRYQVVEDNINRYFSIRERASHKPYTIMQLVVCDTNRQEVGDFKKLWLNKADEIHIKAMHNFLDMGTSIRTSKLSSRQVRRCLQPYNFLIIYWNGDVGLCCWDYNNFVELGNVGSDKLLDIYNNRKLRRIRAAMDKMDCRNIAPCNRCSQVYGEDMNPILEVIKCSEG